MKSNRRYLAAVVALVLCMAVVVPTLSACDLLTPSGTLSVTFDSTHKVYDGDGLDSLRQFLTVRYTDANGATREVNNYTLSGELTVGNRAVTVKYSGVSKTIMITVLEKVEDDGNTDNSNDNSGGTSDDNTGSTGSTGNSGNTGSGNTGNSGSTSGNTGDNTGNSGNSGSGNTGNSGDDNGNSGNSGDNNSGDNNSGNTDSGSGNTDDDTQTPEITLTPSETFVEINTSVTLSASPSVSSSQVEYVFVSGQSCVTTSGLRLTAASKGTVSFYIRANGKISNTVGLQIVDPADDPYTNRTSSSFYSNYNEATSLEDSYWRSQHNFMSGSIANQNQAPTVASSQPTSGNNLVRNSDATYIDNGNTYVVVDSSGNVAKKIYKFGAYVTLEDVAAYVYAFGDIPANYVEDTDTSLVKTSAWGKYLRLNHSSFKNSNTGNYAYEPKLPETGIGGTLKYYEIDIGTTGTNAGGYTPAVYNTGSKITRGAARIVYTRYYSNGNHIDNLEDRYVFYTYNHYNDFQEYLNYQYGWGTIFGNISNGGTYNEGSNPSPYVEVVRKKFSELF